MPGTPGASTAGGATVATDPPKVAATVCKQGLPGTSQVPRLSNAQYNRTIYDLVGATETGLLATEQPGAITKAVWDGYQGSADAIAKQVIADPMLKSKFMKCTPSGDGAACLTETIKQFGRRAYRRPLSTEELADYQKLVTDGKKITKTGTADEVAQVLLATFLKSPSFLQREELVETKDAAGNFKLSSHEVAARLSYVLWGTAPDTMLDSAADANQLQTKDQILTQAKRMVADPKAKDVAQEFHRSYLHLGQGTKWDSAKMKDKAIYDGFEAVVPDMINETEMLFENVFTSGGSFQELLTSTKGYVTARTAKMYGLDPSKYSNTELTAADLPNRPGFLTRIGFLAAYAAPGRTNPITRGAFITKDVLGIDPGAPNPAAAMAQLPTDAALDTIRKKVDALTSASGCATCHVNYVNPPGFVMEAYDAAGQVQTMERDTKAPIDTSAQVKFAFGGDAVAIKDAAELVKKIAQSPSAQRYYVQKWVGYTNSRVLTEPDVCTVDSLSTKLTTSGYSIQNLLTDLTQTDMFLSRALEVTQ
jgi:hypothetical protein